MVKIKRYDHEDIDLLIKLFKETIYTTAKDDYTYDQLKAWAYVDKDRFMAIFKMQDAYVAYLNDEIVGYITYDNGLIDLLYVDKDHTKNGIGRELVKFIMDYYPKPIEVYASNTALPFFTKLGFTYLNENIVTKAGIEIKNHHLIYY